MLSLHFPNDGWNLWSYEDDAFRIAKNILNASLMTPYLK